LSNLNSIAILCGGLARRLSPLTNDIPKSMIDINGKPFIYWQLEKLKKSGFDRVVLCVGKFSDQIINYVGNGRKWNLYISYSIEKRLLGTGGAIKKALPMMTEEFFVIYGDSLLEVDYKFVQQKFVDEKKLSLMCIYKNNDKYDKSNVVYRNGEIISYNKIKPNIDAQYIDFGLNIFSKSVFNKFKEKFDLYQVHKSLLRMKELSVCVMPNRFYEIGSFDGLEELKIFLKDDQNSIIFK
jgi:NDP-sugar pyrophosphorylase family protein